MTNELITWRPASDKPDSDLTVLCWGAEGFFCGYWDDGLQQWIACKSGGSVLGVTHWCEPEGPDEAAERAIGNGQVSAVAASAWLLLAGHEHA